ncbi:MAG: HD domain-containing protein [Candidatus Eremiobacterota bacterium]
MHLDAIRSTTPGGPPPRDRNGTARPDRWAGSVELVHNGTFLAGHVGEYHDLGHSLRVTRLAAELVPDSPALALSGLLHDFDLRPAGTPASVQRTLEALDDPQVRHALRLTLSEAELLRARVDIAATDYPPGTVAFVTRYRGLLEQLPPGDRPAALRQGALLAAADQNEIYTRPFREAVRALVGLSREWGAGMDAVLAQAPGFLDSAGDDTARVLQEIADSMGLQVRVPRQKEFLEMLPPELRAIRQENLEKIHLLAENAAGLNSQETSRRLSELVDLTERQWKARVQ